MKRPLALVWTVVLATALSGCTALTADPGGSRVDGGPAPDASPTTQDGGPALSPLTAFEHEIYGLDASPEERRERRLALEVEIENRTAACMKDEGFDYTPDPSAPEYGEVGVSADGVSDADLEDRPWVSQYGYGIVATPDRAMMDTFDASKGSDDSPNSAYVDALSTSEREAYELALNGVQPTDAEVENGWSLAEAGCSGKARVEVEGEDPRELEEHRQIFEAMEDFYNTFESWDGLAELESAWSACMSERGRGGFTRQSEALEEIAGEYATLWEAANPPRSDASVPSPTGTFAPQTPPPADALKALTEQEVELALVDLDCREQVEYRATYDGIRFAQEERFMADHRAALDAVKAAYEQRGAR